MIPYIRLTHWSNDFEKIPHSEKSRGHACWDGLSPSSQFKGMVFGGRGRNMKIGICVISCDTINISQVELNARDFSFTEIRKLPVMLGDWDVVILAYY